MNYGGNICRIVVALLILKDKTGYSSLWQIDHCFLIFLRVARYAMVKLHEMNDLWSSHIGNLIIMNRYTHANQNGLITIPNKRKQSMLSPIMNYHYILWILMNYHDLYWNQLSIIGWFNNPFSFGQLVLILWTYYELSTIKIGGIHPTYHGGNKLTDLTVYQCIKYKYTVVYNFMQSSIIQKTELHVYMYMYIYM